MDDDDQFLHQVLSGITEADIITIFFPLLRRSLLVDTRHNDATPQMVTVLPQVTSMEERIASIERLRPHLGKVRSILGIPWMRSVHSLQERGVTEQLSKRLIDTGMPAFQANLELDKALGKLRRIEQRAFVSMIHGEGYQTIWAEQQ